MVNARQSAEDRGMDEGQLQERVVRIRRVTKVVAGGRRRGFSAMVVVGDGQGRVGMGLGKAEAVPDAVRKGVSVAKKNLVSVTLNGTTIPHEVLGKHCASTVLLKPAAAGKGVIAGGPVRAVCEVLGVKDIVAKSMGTANPHNVIRATLKALSKQNSPKQISIIRNKKISEIIEKRG